MRIQTQLLALFLLATPACMTVSSPNEAPLRSPTLDYPMPPPQGADGQVIGADGVPPEDKIRMGPRLGSTGVLPSEGPTVVEKSGPEPVGAITDPLCQALGVAESARRDHCRPSLVAATKR